MSRSIGPNEHDPWGPLRGGEFVGARTHIGTIVSVDTTKGTMWVVIERTNRPFECAIPGFYGVSLAGACWSRHIPIRNMKCRVAYDVDDRPVFVGWAAYETLKGNTAAEANREGYAALLQRSDAGVSGMRLFRAAGREGEFDMRSIGGAYIAGRDTGQLLLAGGAVALDLNPVRDVAAGEAARWRLGARGAYFEVGDVRRRLLPTDVSDTTIPASGTAFRVSGSTLEGGTTVLTGGDVRDATGLPIPGVAGTVVAALGAASPLGNDLGGVVLDSSGGVVVSGATQVVVAAPSVALGAAEASQFVAYGVPTETSIRALATAVDALAGIVTGLVPPSPGAAAVVLALQAIQQAVRPMTTVVATSTTVRTT